MEDRLSKILRTEGSRRDMLKGMLKLGIGIGNLSIVINCVGSNGCGNNDTQKENIYKDDTNNNINPPEQPKNVPFLFDYNSLLNVKEKIIKINGLNALTEIFQIYNPHENIANKKSTLNNILNKYNFSESDESYLINVAHTLWVEKNGGFNWSIKDYSHFQIHNLIERSRLNKFSPNYLVCGEYIESAKDWYKLFPLTNFVIHNLNKSIELNHKESAKEIVSFVEKNFFHAYNDPSADEYWGWDTYKDSEGKIIPITKITLEEIFKERIIGCHFGSHILISMLRSINIPAYETHEPYENFEGNEQHGVTYIPTLDLYVHGDYLADFAAIPSSDLLMTKNELGNWLYTDRGYLSFHDYIFNNQRQYKLNLKRKDDYLYIAETTLCEDITPYKDYIKKQLKEFDVSFQPDDNCYKLISKNVNIKTLDELSNL